MGTLPLIASVIQPTHTIRDIDDEIPTTSLLSFPPFPAQIPTDTLIPFAHWTTKGVWIQPDPSHRSGSTTAYGKRDALGNALIDVSEPVSAAERALKAEERRVMRLANCASGTRLTRDDCFRIGKAGDGWEEPVGTSRSSYDISIPPFTRLISATRDFIYSRHEELQYNRTKRLFILLRNAFGLRTDFPGEHLSGSGPHAIAYQPPRNVIKGKQTSNEAESCVLLSKTEMSVRGFLALARKEAEAGWDVAPALKLVEITSAFLSFIEFHQVLSEPEYISSVRNAATLAREASDQLVNAKIVEDALCEATAWNRACWTVWGGQYGGAERGGMEKEVDSWPVVSAAQVESHDEDDGGWELQEIQDLRPVPLESGQARHHMESMMDKETTDKVSLQGHLPYARRRISAVIPPATASPFFSSTARCHWRLVTVKAPWTAAEKWRGSQLLFEDDFDGTDSTDGDSISLDALEGEQATIAEPNELDIWIEGEALQTLKGGPQAAIGMGLRGRWGLMGTCEATWWAFKAKDYVLPALWYTPEEKLKDSESLQ